ncbi:uncharacterized protein LOC110036728 [Phalaenopsis equestris]|uniref:uncharacterized protein LOC110036728 n=1 Tax=Phalaenopsis equestris TaxID=78828 RepID=UPI0009E18F1F|nr:uncharacterized protein LOC110036728 [Phalaenopsis equestris]
MSHSAADPRIAFSAYLGSHEHREIPIDPFRRSPQGRNDLSESSNARTSPSLKARASCTKKIGHAYLRSQIFGLVTTCINLSSKASIAQQSSSIPDVMKILEQIPKVYEDISLYVYSLKQIEDPTKRDIFTSMALKRTLHYFHFFYENFISN